MPSFLTEDGMTGVKRGRVVVSCLPHHGGLSPYGGCATAAAVQPTAMLRLRTMADRAGFNRATPAASYFSRQYYFGSCYNLLHYLYISCYYFSSYYYL